MTLAEIITLAKQGYKLGDIKELLELAKEQEDTEEETQKEVKTEAPKDNEVQNGGKTETKTEAPKDNEVQNGGKTETKTEALKDNSEIEQLKDQIEKLKKDLATAQEENRSRDNGSDEEKDNDTALSDIVRNFY